MTWQEFQAEFDEMSLENLEMERLGRLAAFSLPPSANAEDTVMLEEAKRRIRDEIARRRDKGARLDEAIFRRQERQKADRQHDEHVAQSSRMHVAQMERAHATFTFHRRSIWIAAAIAIVSALLAWYSFWHQRRETRRAIENVMERLDALEAGTKGMSRERVRADPDTTPR